VVTLALFAVTKIAGVVSVAVSIVVIFAILVEIA
jgi:hypothetical protein